jgi:hypothetical protein
MVIASGIAPGGRGQLAAGTQDVPGGTSAAGDHCDSRRDAYPAYLVLVAQSGAKRQIPQPSAATGIAEAEQVMRRCGGRLRAVKVVSRNRAIARWKADELRWRRVA